MALIINLILKMMRFFLCPKYTFLSLFFNTDPLWSPWASTVSFKAILLTWTTTWYLITCWHNITIRLKNILKNHSKFWCKSQFVNVTSADVSPVSLMLLILLIQSLRKSKEATSPSISFPTACKKYDEELKTKISILFQSNHLSSE